MMKIRQFILAIAALGQAFAHDMWIEPTTFSPAPDQVVGVRLRVGQDLVGDPLPRDPSLIRQFVVESGSGPRPVPGRIGGNPAGILRVSGPGLHVIGYRSNRSSVEQAPEQFERYLKEEGLEAIANRRNQNGAKVREVFSRCAKSLVLAGPGRPAQSDRVLGFTLELVAEKNPFTLSPADDLPVRLTYEGRPLAGALVVAINRMNPSEKLAARTGVDGRVRFRLPHGGMWLVKAVHMIPAPAETNAEWESFWASLTFDAGAAGTAKGD